MNVRLLLPLPTKSAHTSGDHYLGRAGAIGGAKKLDGEGVEWVAGFHPSPATDSCAAPGKSQNLSGPPLPHLYNLGVVRSSAL